MHCRRLGQPQPGKPWLVVLHGLLGSGEDWQPMLPYLADWPLLLVDLPGHGESRSLQVVDFADVSRQLATLLAQHAVTDYWLLGYSLGGRIAMYHACQGSVAGLQGLLVEGGHPGLASAEEREARRQHDADWARRFRHEPLKSVLPDWYRQPVFARLSPAQRESLMVLRSGNHGPAIADMLEATSLSRQPYLIEALHQLQIPFGYLCGSQDTKFQALAAQHRLPLLSVDGAGHNAHQANPSGYAERVRQFISHPERKTQYALSQ
ncbi:2-succinyl-6-hydroxy-2,4-cyclohexadiene-1-carboxylate synthase [Dickeya sp. CFBP 2040]|uniref:2-succinyl-6-hydroxy-2, 4-cyclohexadiene-1-carboxylate synthase n=1 Tax=Dickeya sp. CFBP 2040 TaxID=2718531 RepID=UPI0014454971|nr:2-succinyl-6-hydroxy-2,4-cyclohexadiene-1-carboxylate synthase [Dickeya sp. CFBP 2040]NKI75499.1 2-succinyl-6-hydroxy-2,4-cyclohexadiene-1-carboxylate synthase [Dickeya sp. CFBP 2040]